MLHRLTTMARAAAATFGRALHNGAAAFRKTRRPAPALLLLLAAGAGAWALYENPPLESVPRGDVVLRTNQFSGSVDAFRDGTLLVLPGLHETRTLPLRDQSYRPQGIARADGAAPLQSVEGLSLGLDLTLRWALDTTRLPELARKLPDDIEADVLEPAVQGVVYRLIARHTVREIFSSQRAEIQQAIETELRQRLGVDGVLLRGVQIGSVDLPPDYRKGMDGLLADSLASERMRYTLEIADKRVRETELQANADKVKREVAAQAAGREQIIAAQAQEEAMKHVLPFKQRQIEQRRLEADAESASRVRLAEGAAKARHIEVEAEAQARQKLADAEAYRLAQIGHVNIEQMSAEGALISRHPLLVQKAMADKLSDKVQVIIAPPPAAGGFIGDALLGAMRTTTNAGPDGDGAHETADDAARGVVGRE